MAPAHTPRLLDLATCDPQTKWNRTPNDQRARMFGVPAAPVFHPTAQEWAASPLKYIESIRAKGEEWGIVKIVPPKGWNPGFHINQETFKFETRIQKLNSIDGSSRSTVNYLDQLELFHEQSGTMFTRVPLLDNKPLDLRELKKEVEKRGGVDSVSDSMWTDIAVALGANKKSSTASQTARSSYMTWIHPYEEFVRANLKFVSSSESQPQTKAMGMGRIMTSAGRMMKRIAESNEDGAEVEEKIPVSSNCQICNLGKSAGKLLKCDQCKMRFHMSCLNPTVTHVPEHEWYCALCLKTHGDDFGFQQEGSLQSLAEFQKVADDFKERYFRERRREQNRMEEDGRLCIEEEEMEQEFWKLVEDNRFTEDGVEVQYGADLHSSQHGSGFPVVERDPLNPYSRSPWNVNNMPVLADSLFCNIRNDISGMMVPWLYVGMAFSAFCWHTEDHYTYSVNYNHWGDTKTWYGIPASDAVKFEVLMKKKVPELFETNPDLLFHLTTIMSPRHLQENMLNFAEAVNFALPSWLPYGLSCTDRYIRFHKQPVFSHEELVIATALKDPSVKTCLWLKAEIDILCEREVNARNSIRTTYGVQLTEITETDTLTSQSRNIFCEVCRAYCFCTSVGLACAAAAAVDAAATNGNDSATASHASKVVCYRHVSQLQNHCECPTKELVMRIRFTDSELLDLQKRVTKVAKIPEDWLNSYIGLMMENHRPPLKDMQKLVAAGDRMASANGYVLEEWGTLKGFVAEADAWVVDAKRFLAGGGASKKPSSRAKGSVSAVASDQSPKLDGHDFQPHLASDRTLDTVVGLLKRVDDLPFACPEIEALQELSSDAVAFRDRMLGALSRDPLVMEELDALLSELSDPESSLQLKVSSVELLDEACKDLQWMKKAEDVLADPLAFYEDIDAVVFSGKGYTVQLKDESALQAQLPGFVAMKKRKTWLAVEVRKKRARADNWKIDSMALMKQKSIHPRELKDLIDFRSKGPVVKETFTLLVAQYDAVQAAIRQVRRLVQSNPNPDEPAPNPSAWDIKPPVAGLMAKVQDIMATLELPIRFDELPIFLREIKKVEEWSVKGRRLFPKSAVPKSLAEIIKEVGASYDAVENVAQEEQYCFCRHKENGIMVGCDVCGEWYHGICLGIGKRTLKDQSDFVCPLCDTENVFQRATGKRASIEQLVAFVHEAETGLSMVPEELGPLKALLERLLAWKRSSTEYATRMGEAAVDKDILEMRNLVRCLEGFPVEIDNSVSDALYAKFSSMAPKRVREVSVVSTVPSEMPLAATEHEGVELHCICRKPETDDMIACDHCDSWYHFPCVGLTADSAAMIESYKCPPCVEKGHSPLKKIVLKIPKKIAALVAAMPGPSQWSSVEAPTPFPAMNSLARAEMTRLLTLNRPISLRLLTINDCLINPPEFRAIQHFENRHPELFSHDPIRIHSTTYGDTKKCISAFARLAGSQMAAFERLTPMPEFRDVLKEAKRI
ncbi:hypothetical protein HDU98_004211 [Podochytrium sp. JEL0797]|nr:hypothetical protein HDU98_004211 [Podochytrium sp. JEL0797]